MFKNYFKITCRNLLKNKVYALINILGLASGMAVTIMIGLWIADEFNFNKSFKNHDTIAQVYQSTTRSGQKSTGFSIPRPLEFSFRESYKENFKYIAMSSWTNPYNLKFGETTISREGNYIQEDALKIFEPTISKGVQNGLKDKMSIMLSESTAKALLGDTDPIDKIVTVENDNMKVTAVYKDFPFNSVFYDVHYLMPWKHYITTRDWIKNSADQWGNSSFQMFVQIPDNTTFEAVNHKIKDVKKNADKRNASTNPEIFLLPMKDWHLRSNFENSVQTGGRIENVRFFGIIGFFVLLLACINFINLSTARSEKRAKEVGIRKAIGSSRKQLINQFLSESFVLVFLAFLVSIVVVLIFLNGFNQLADKEITFPWSNGQFWICSLAFIVVTALVSGSYPAFYLSSFNPVTVLKGTINTGKASALPRKILVVVQFTVSVGLIICTLVVMSQIQYSKDRPVGYTKAGLIQIPSLGKAFGGKSDLMREQFIASGGAVEMATSSSPATELWNNMNGYTWEGKPEGFEELFGWTEVSFEFVKTLGMKVIDGRDFSRDFASDSSAVLINKTAVAYMGLSNPVGKTLWVEKDEGNEPVQIIGVVEDVIMESPYSPIKPQLYFPDQNASNNFYNIRLNPNNSTSKNLDLVEKAYKKVFPDLPYSYQFIDEQYALKFESEERVAGLAKVFTLLAIFISCLGLFGLASYVAERRTKEFGVRKVLGASVSNLWTLICKDFLVLIAMALLLAFPLAYYISENWLQKFDYRTHISWWLFIVSGMGALLISIITISFQAIKVAVSNPIKSLRTE